MIEKYKVLEKTKEEALEKLKAMVNTEIDNLIISEFEQEAKLFKGKKIELLAIKKEDIINYVKQYIKELSNNFGIDIKSEVKLKDGIINVLLVSENNAILIGKDGRTLNALQILLRQSLNTQTNMNFKFYVDASDYKAKKNKNVEYEVKKIAREVLKTKIEAKLDPMNSYQRRIVHTIIGEYDNLETKSVGEEPNRYTIIKYKD